MNCPSCASPKQPEHRFCSNCGKALSPGGIGDARAAKVTQLFMGVPDALGDESDSVLRASRYRQEHEFVAPEGTVHLHDQHVRLSIWVVDRPVCAISLSDEEAGRLAEFLSVTADQHPQTRSPGIRAV
jgi:hypothetical protein